MKSPLGLLALLTACAPTVAPPPRVPVTNTTTRDVAQTEPSSPPPTRTRWGVQIGGRDHEMEFASAFAPDGTSYVIVDTPSCVTATSDAPELCSGGKAPDQSTRIRVFVRIAPDGRVDRFVAPEWKHMFPIDLVVRRNGDLLAIARDHREAFHLLRIDRHGALIEKLAWHASEEPKFLATVGDDVYVTGIANDALVVTKSGTRREPREEGNVFVTRLDPELRPRWSHMLQGDHRKYSGHDWPTSIATTSDGGVVVTGECRAETFAPDEGDVRPLECGSLANSDVFFAKWSPNGRIEWLRNLRSSVDHKESYGTMPGDLAATANGGVAFTLMFDGTLRTGPGKHDDITSHGWQDVVLGELDGDGRLKWWHTIGGQSWDEANHVVFDGERVWAVVTGALERTDLDPVRLTEKAKHESALMRPVPTAWLLGYDGAGKRIVARDLYRRSAPRMYNVALGIGEGGLRIVTEISSELEVSADGEQRIYASRGADDVLVEGLPLAR